MKNTYLVLLVSAAAFAGAAAQDALTGDPPEGTAVGTAADVSNPFDGFSLTEGPKAATEPATPPTGPTTVPAAISSSGFIGSHVSLGLADGLVRVARGSDWLLLANPRIMASDDDEQVYGLGFLLRRRPGVGIRQTMYLRLDVRNTPGDNWFTTTSVGWERRTPDYVGRFRGFVSPHGSEVIERRVEEETRTGPNGSTETLRRIFERIEIPLTGAEAEAGFRLPLPRWLGDVRFLGGAHYRDGPDFDSESGWLTRVEYRPRDRFTFEFATYFNRDFTEAELIVGVSAIFPFGGGNSADIAGSGGGSEAFWFEPPPHNPRATSLKGGAVRRTRQQIIATTPARRKIASAPSQNDEPEAPEEPEEPWEPEEGG